MKITKIAKIDSEQSEAIFEKGRLVTRLSQTVWMTCIFVQLVIQMIDRNEVVCKYSLSSTVLDF